MTNTMEEDIGESEATLVVVESYVLWSKSGAIWIYRWWLGGVVKVAVVENLGFICNVLKDLEL